MVEGDAVTFVWQGEADPVWLRHFMMLEVAGVAFTCEPDSDGWR